MPRRVNTLMRMLMLATIGMAVTHAPARAAETVRIGGTGMAIAAMNGIRGQLAGNNPALSVDVLPSMGSKGGLRALADGAVQVATVARPLSADERALGLTETVCFDTPLVFATSRPRPDGVARGDLPALYDRADATWSDGTPLKVIMRAHSGSELPYLASRVPGLDQAFAKAFKRQGMAIGATDQENAELAQRINGSFAIMTLLQIRSENLPLQVVPVDGVVPSPETLANGQYPFSIRLCVVLSSEPTPGALALVRQVRSDEGEALFRHLGAEPVR